MKIFFLLSRFPYPLEKGDKLRAFHQIKYLSRKHDIFLCAVSDSQLSEKDFNHLKPYCKAIKVIKLSRIHVFLNLIRALFLKLPFQVGYFYSPQIKNIIEKNIEKHKPNIIFCQLIRMAEYVKHIRSVPLVLDYMDAFSKGVERRMEKSSFYLRVLLKIEQKRLLCYEQKIFNDFNLHTIISEQDKQHIRHPDAEKIIVVPNGVDTTFFYPQNTVKKYDVVFVGNMNYPPNIDSALLLAKKIFPLVLKKKPEARLLIAGAGPAKEIRMLQSKNIEVTGWVEDIRSCYAESKIFVAPMKISIGLQNKLLEAMAMKIPCVTSPLANNAVNAPDDCILTASTVQEYAEHIVYLLNHAAEADKIAEKAYSFVKKNYKWETIISELEKSICRLPAQQMGIN